MEVEIIYSIVGIIIFIIIIFITLKKTNSSINRDEIKPTKNKKIDIINGYKKRLKDELQILNGDKEAIKSRKKVLLKEFNMELSRNIFFDKDEIKDVIFDLCLIDENSKQ